MLRLKPIGRYKCTLNNVAVLMFQSELEVVFEGKALNRFLFVQFPNGDNQVYVVTDYPKQFDYKSQTLFTQNVVKSVLAKAFEFWIGESRVKIIQDKYNAWLRGGQNYVKHS